jgi:hypothetical protein
VGPGGNWTAQPGHHIGFTDLNGALEFRGNAPTGSGPVFLHAALPTTSAGTAMRLRAVTVCADTSDPAFSIDRVRVSTRRGTISGGTVPQTGTFSGTPFGGHSSQCARVPAPTPLALEPNGFVEVQLDLSWTASGSAVRIGGTTFELDRTP